MDWDSLIFDVVYLIHTNFWLIFIIIALLCSKYWQAAMFVLAGKIGFPEWIWQWVIFIVLYILFEEFFEPRSFWKRFYKKKCEREIQDYRSKYEYYLYYLKSIEDKKRGGS